VASTIAAGRVARVLTTMGKRTAPRLEPVPRATREAPPELPALADAEQTLQSLAGALFPAGLGDWAQLSWPGEVPATEADAPEPRTMEARLRAAEIRYRTLVEQIPAVTFMAALGEGENEIYVSPHIETLLGFTQKEWLENPFLWYAQLHPDDRVLWNDEFARGVRTGGPFRAECRFLARDGHVVWVRGEARLVKDKVGRPLFLQGVAFDITESKRVERLQIEEAVRSTEQRYRDLVEELGAIFWETDAASGQVTFVSGAAESILGFPRERWMGDPDFWLSRVHAEDRARVAAVRDRALDFGGEHEVEFRVVTSDQRAIWMHAAMRGPRSAADERYLFGVMMDITGRKEAEQERSRLYAAAQEARSLAEAASRAKDEFLATMSHELRTPLNALLGYAQLLRERSLPPARIDYALERIEAAARTQSRLVEDLLDMSRIVTGKLSLDVTTVDLSEVVGAALETVRPAAAGKQIKLSAPQAVEPLSVPGDAVRLQQVVWNLLANAVKFTPDNGRVEVRLEPAGRYARISVIDTGPGIAPDFLPYVFERFRQADDTSTRNHGGLGLGLAIVRHLVEMHGGSVRAESAGLGHGAAFVVELPRTAATTTAPDDGSESAQAARKPLAGVRVLVIDDDPDALDLFRTALAHAGARVSSASSVAQALGEAGRVHPDVVVSDIAMPGQDGYELLERIRAGAPGSPAPRAVAVTAYVDEEHRRRAFEVGFEDYLTKPLDVQAIVAAVTRLIRGEPR
jgi:PAS domain S-box-containing protein